MRRTDGWHGSVGELLRTDRVVWLRCLRSHYANLPPGGVPSSQQIAAWTEEFAVLNSALQSLVRERHALNDVGIVFEYELPREGGRRPDVVLISGQNIVVLEFKQRSKPTPADVDQAQGYARDLANYHALEEASVMSQAMRKQGLCALRNTRSQPGHDVCSRTLLRSACETVRITGFL